LTEAGQVRLGSAAGRWTVAAAVLGSGAVFLESTVVTVALPSIGREFRLGMDGLQWVMNGYLLTLSALILLGGSLGDVYRRRLIFVGGLVGFALASGASAMAPSLPLLVGCRLLQGAAGALLVPNSLAILDTVFAEEDRGAAIGQWAAWSSASTALGPLLGGWLVDQISWRWVFASVVPFALAAAWIGWRKIPDISPAGGERRSVDYLGAVLVTLGLAGLTAALVSGPAVGFTRGWILIAGLGGILLLAAFFVLERRIDEPVLPMGLFRSRQFTGANITTVLVYAALSGLFFFLILELQNALGYGALQAGAALLPVNALMLALSPVAGRLSSRIGARLPMTVGAALAGVGLMLLARVQTGSDYLGTVLPALIVFGLGLATLVAPLTAAVLGAVPSDQAGIASAVNNAAARLAGLLATAVLPLAAGLSGSQEPGGAAMDAAFVRMMWICADLCLAGAAVAFLTVRSTARVGPITHPSASMGCTHRRPVGKRFAEG
jgi:EmrB/QacA subfamily drug resistance transporter